MRSVLEPCALPISTLHVPASNTAAVVTVAADVDQYFVVDSIIWSYSDIPTAGRLTVAIGGVTFLDIDITAAGPGQPIHMPVYNYLCTLNEALVVTLAAGGSGVSGKLNVRYR